MRKAPLRHIVFLFAMLYICLPVKSQSTDNAISEEDVIKMTSNCWELREKNPDSALTIGIRAKEIAESHNYTKVLPQINGFLGVIYFHYLYDLKNAIPYLQESLERSMEVNDSTRLAYSFNNLGDVYMMSGNIPLALDYSKNSLSIFEKLNNKRGIAYAYINLGLIYEEKARYDIAEMYFKKAMELRHELNDSTGYASAIYQLGRSQLHKGNLEEAMKNYKISYNYHLNIDNLTYTAYCLNGMATINYLNGAFDKALELYLKAIELHKLKGHSFGLIEDYLGIAMVYAELGNSEDGNKALSKALELSSHLEMHPKVLETYKVYADFYQTLNNKEAALESLKKYVQLYDSVLILQQLEVLEEVERMNSTENSLQLAEQKLEIRTMERKYLLVIIFLMIILVAVIVWRLLTQSKLNKRLREANNTKDKLFSVISHDLRSPFNTIMGFSELLKTSVGENDPDSQIYADAVYQQSSETMRLIDNLLTWSRSQSNKIKYNPQEVSIDNLFKQLNSAFEFNATANKVKLRFGSSVKGDVILDKTIIKIILSNLISNSLKFTPNDGVIEVNASETKKGIQFVVSDTGVGIPSESLSKISSLIAIETKKGLRNESGTGLGLSICYDMLKLHKGGMKIESKLEKGTKFTITFPVQQ